MRLSLAAAFLFALGSIGFAGNLAPMSLKEVSLMLRSGYSSDAVEREVATRHFIGTLDANVQAGASPAL